MCGQSRARRQLEAKDLKGGQETDAPTLDFWPPNCGEKQLYCIRSPCLGSFVPVAPEDEPTQASAPCLPTICSPKEPREALISVG
jgi:hypothetical protein